MDVARYDRHTQLSENAVGEIDVLRSQSSGLGALRRDHARSPEDLGYQMTLASTEGHEISDEPWDGDDAVAQGAVRGQVMREEVVRCSSNTGCRVVDADRHARADDGQKRCRCVAREELAGLEAEGASPGGRCGTP